MNRRVHMPSTRSGIVLAFTSIMLLPMAFEKWEVRGVWGVHFSLLSFNLVKVHDFFSEFIKVLYFYVSWHLNRHSILRLLRFLGVSFFDQYYFGFTVKLSLHLRHR